MDFRKRIEEGLAESAYVKLLLLQRQAGVIEEIARRLTKTLRAGRTIFLFGNGGSAADAQHLAAELEARFLRERRALPCLALCVVGFGYVGWLSLFEQLPLRVRKAIADVTDGFNIRRPADLKL